MAEEDVRLEVEAMQAVYGDDCLLIRDFPPHLIVHIKPRTADDSSQQFVEVTIGIKASSKYPEELPCVYITDMKGMDDCRQMHLTTSIQKRAQELSSCLMLVALCEEAVDILTNMNHPEGDCPLCLYPLVSDDRSNSSLPFMKLMSCYHCFHSECMVRLWKWIQDKNEPKERNQSLETALVSAEIQIAQRLHNSMNQQKGNCPVCRKVFDANDIEHVLEYLAAYSSVENHVEAVADEEEKAVLLSDVENSRRQKFQTILKLQQEKNGLIEPRKDLVILPGMFLPETVELPKTSAEAENEQCKGVVRGPDLEVNGGISDKATTSKHKNSERRRKGGFRAFKGQGIPESVELPKTSAEADLEVNGGISNKATTSKHNNSDRRKGGFRGFKGQVITEPVELPKTSAEAQNEQCKGDVRSPDLEVNGGMSDKATTSKHKNSARRRKGGFCGFKGQGITEPSRKQWVVKPLNTTSKQ